MKDLTHAEGRMFPPGATRGVWFPNLRQSLPVDLRSSDQDWYSTEGADGALRLFVASTSTMRLEGVKSLLSELLQVEGVVPATIGRADGCLQIPLVEGKVNESTAEWCGTSVSVLHGDRFNIGLEFAEDALVDVDGALCVVLGLEDAWLLARQLASVLAWQDRLDREFGGAACMLRLRIAAGAAAGDAGREAVEEARRLAVEAMEDDGDHHKQYALVRIAELLGATVRDGIDRGKRA